MYLLMKRIYKTNAIFIPDFEPLRYRFTDLMSTNFYDHFTTFFSKLKTVNLPNRYYEVIFKFTNFFVNCLSYLKKTFKNTVNSD